MSPPIPKRPDAPATSSSRQSPSPPSPSASFYDVSDAEEGEYNTISHTRTGRGVKLLFSKSKVYIHPTPSAKDNIPGFIALIQQKPATNASASTTTDRPSSSSSSASINAASYLLAWVPESSLGDAYSTYVKVDQSDDNSPPRQTHLVPPLPTVTTARDEAIGMYAFAVPLKAIYSLLVRPPSLGWWFGSLVINTRAGDSFPALFFHDSECESTILQRKRHASDRMDPFNEDGTMFWGADEVLRWLRRYVKVERSGPDPNVYLIDPSEEDRKSFGQQASAEKDDKKKSGNAGKGKQPRDAGMDPLTKALKEARWKILEQFSRVTTFTRQAANDIAENPKVPPQVRRLMKNPEVQTLQDEFDSARLYLARWAMGIAEQSEREKNQRIWTARDFLAKEDSAVGEFEILDLEDSSVASADKRNPVTLKEWNGWLDARGRFTITANEVKERIFHGGLDPNDGVRKEAWLFLLGVHPWDSSADERKALMNSKRDEFVRLKGAWWDRMLDGSATQEEHEWWKEQKGRIEKDVHRTDRNIPLFAGEDISHPDPDSPFADVGTNVHMEQMKDMLLTYNEYNPDLGYVQGMSDLLAPIYAVMQDDAVAFWGFVGFMDRMERNFLRDQSGMRSQLLTLDHLVQLMDPKLYVHLQSVDSTNFFFFFRMLLVWYKREFEWQDTLRLWEGLWTDYLSSSFHLFIALSILEKHRDVIMTHLKGFDEVLKYVNELSNNIDLPSTIVRAEVLFHRFERTLQAIDKKDSFPSAPTATLPTAPKPSHARASSRDDVNATDADRPTSSGSATQGPQSPSTISALASQPWANASSSSQRRNSNQNKPNKNKSPALSNQHQPHSAHASADPVPVKVISPELRSLLSTKIVTVSKKELKKSGGGTAALDRENVKKAVQEERKGGASSGGEGASSSSSK